MIAKGSIWPSRDTVLTMIRRCSFGVGTKVQAVRVPHVTNGHRPQGKKRWYILKRNQMPSSSNVSAARLRDFPQGSAKVLAADLDSRIHVATGKGNHGAADSVN